MKAQVFNIPDLGEAEDVAVIEICVKAGESVDYEDPIISLRGFENEWLWKSSWIIDDGDVAFQRFYGPNWIYQDVGYNDDSWTVPISTNEQNSAHSAIWVPALAYSGEFNIDVFVPNIPTLSTAAQY